MDEAAKPDGDWLKTYKLVSGSVNINAGNQRGSSVPFSMIYTHPSLHIRVDVTVTILGEIPE